MPIYIGVNTNRGTYYIGDIARHLGLSQRTIRYYEELGFIKPLRTEGGFRTYAKSDVDFLKIIVHFKDLGMSLDDIRTLFKARGGTLTVEFVRHLRAALIERRKEFEIRLKRFEKAIQEIDAVLGVMSNCTSCGRPGEGEVCEQCLKERGGEETPLISPLLQKTSV